MIITFRQLQDKSNKDFVFLPSFRTLTYGLLESEKEIYFEVNETKTHLKKSNDCK